MIGNLHDLIHQNLFRSKCDVEQDKVGACDVAVIQQWAFKGIRNCFLRAPLTTGASRSHDGTSTVTHHRVHVVHVHVNFPCQRDDLGDSFGSGAQDLVGVGKCTADGLIAKQLAQLVIADDEQRVDGFTHGLKSICGLLIPTTAFELEWHGHNANSQNSTLLAGLGDDWCSSCSCSASHAGGHKDHARVVAQK